MINVERFLFCFSLFVLVARGGPGKELSSSELLDRMEEAGRLQRENLQNWSSTRTYSARNTRLHQWATVKIQLEYAAPGKKTYSVLDRAGSGLIAKRVIYPIIEAERQSAAPKVRVLSDINRTNYTFKLTGFDATEQAYVFQATPRAPARYQFRGSIWVDAATYGIKRVQGAPAVAPSFWVKSTEFFHEYAVFDGFWLPVRHHSEAQIRLFGTSTLDIVYENYRCSARKQ